MLKKTILYKYILYIYMHVHSFFFCRVMSIDIFFTHITHCFIFILLPNLLYKYYIMHVCVYIYTHINIL